MSKVVFGLVLGGILGIFDGLTALLSAPEVAPQIVGIVIGSTLKGLVAGAIIGYFARKVRSLPLGLLFGLAVGVFFAWLVTLGGPYFWEIIVPGALVGLIVGYATQRHGETATSSPPAAMILLLLVFSFPGSSRAAEPGTGTGPGGLEERTRGFVESLQAFHEVNRRNVLAAAREAGEELYSFRPTPEVRTFGELVGHISDTLFFACSEMRGEANPNEKDHRPGVVGEDSIERNRSSKDKLVAAAEAAFAYCGEPFSQLADGGGAADRQRSAAFAATLAVYHTATHYGNVVTYLRLNGLVPPSSAPAPAATGE